MSEPKFKIYLANPRGFCAGVDRAIDIVVAALEKFGPPVYVRHEVVHNRYVVEDLKSRGAIFVDELSEVPDENVVVFSAHGVSQAVREEADSRNLTTILDATCPLVTKVHMEVIRHSKKGHECVLIGHAGHAEVEGTLGQYRNSNGAIYLVEKVQDIEHLKVNDPENLAYVTQTTLSVDDTQHIIQALQKKFPKIQGPKRDDICYATQNRQDAVKQLSKKCDLVLVVGSQNSSNSNRLRELAEQCGKKAYLLDSTDQIDLNWFEGMHSVGITAGASAPEILVQKVIEYLKTHCAVDGVEPMDGIQENIVFSLPKSLREVPEKA